MKLNTMLTKSTATWNRFLINATVFFCLFGAIPNARLIADPTPQTDPLESDDAVKEIKRLNQEILAKHVTNFGYSRVVDRYEQNQAQLTRELLQIFDDQTASVTARGCAANYLGELRSESSVNDLTSKIGFQFHFEGVQFHSSNDIPDIREYPAQQALIKIGIASIPALIRNLAQSDDAQTRKLSLEAINRIEGDRDIVQIRLQKAVKAETDQKKQARLQAALKSLDEAKF